MKSREKALKTAKDKVLEDKSINRSVPGSKEEKRVENSWLAVSLAVTHRS